MKKGLVEAKHVQFAYEEGHPVLRDLNFKANPGETIAIVGPSGAGKSTIANLLPRFYEITGGEIDIDGMDIRKADLGSLRDQIGLVPQDTLLFNTSIKDNVLYGRLDATDEEVWAAVRSANAEKFIRELPDGIDTRVGDRGLILSGGQRQRIAIARAILKNPKILILDEATSALDTESEKVVQDALDKLMVGRTAFVIAHRLSTIKNADQILVLNDGVIAERGTHDELMAKGGLYYDLYTMSAKVTEAEDSVEDKRKRDSELVSQFPGFSRHWQLDIRNKNFPQPSNLKSQISSPPDCSDKGDIPLYWFYNICLVAYWILQIPLLIYRLVFEEGFYDRLKQSAGIMPTPTLLQIADHNAIWVHAASVGEVVAASPIVRELKKKYPDEMVVVSVVTATGHRMAQRIIPEADGHIFFPFDLPVITERIVNIVNPKAIILIETELWPNFLRLAWRKKIPVMMMNGRISGRSMRRYSLIKRFTTRMLLQIRNSACSPKSTGNALFPWEPFPKGWLLQEIRSMTRPMRKCRKRNGPSSEGNSALKGRALSLWPAPPMAEKRKSWYAPSGKFWKNIPMPAFFWQSAKLPVPPRCGS